jgi:hypothetical protein
MNAILDLDYARESNPLPPIWDLLYTFREHHQSKAWKYYNNGTVVETNDEYHRFIWTRQLHIHTFRNLIHNPSCTICIHKTYMYTHPTYTAWILTEPPRADVWLYLIQDAPELLPHVAIYDLSQIYSEGSTSCLTINKTQSAVFNAFEQFLATNHNISCHQLTGLTGTCS